MSDTSASRNELSQRRFRLLFASILVVAGVWRFWLAAEMPCLSRDGAKFCWMAQQLERVGADALRAIEFDQHPAYPFAIRLVTRALSLVGFAAEPLTWQRAGQVVSWSSGMGVLVLTGLLTMRLVRRLELPVDERLAALLAMGLTTVLDLHAWLSADVMSDSLYLLAFLGGLLVLLTPRGGAGAALASGTLAGLAFLTRPEAIVLCVGAGVYFLAELLRDRRSADGHTGGFKAAALRRGALGMLLFGLGFLVPAAPYWAWIGGLSPKVNKETIDRFRPAVVVRPPIEFARLQREEFSWYGACGAAAYETLRAGRVVVPVIGLIAFWRMRPQWANPVLAAILACAAMHVALTVLLPYRHGYLHPRHTLLVVTLLTPLAGVALGYFGQRMAARGRRFTAAFLIVLCLAGPAPWATRVPNRKDAAVARAAAALREKDEALPGKRLLTDSSGRRIAFYCGMEFVPWPENEPTEAARLDALRARLANWENPPEYFAIATGPREWEGNDRLVAGLLGDAALAGKLREVVREPGADGVVIRVFARDR